MSNTRFLLRFRQRILAPHPTLPRPNLSFKLSSTSRTFVTSSPPRGLRATEGGEKNPQRDAQQDREKMNTDANEYAKSGTDDAAAKNEEAAFDPEITDPQHAKQKAGEGNDQNPLDVSPANPDVSQTTSENQGSGAGKKVSEGGGGR